MDGESLEDWRKKDAEELNIGSQWRQKQNEGNYNLRPGLDEIKKISMYLRKKVPDYKIMEAFGVNSEILTAIKKNCYNPVDGIMIDTQEKIHKRFDKIDKNLTRIYDELEFFRKEVKKNKLITD